MLTRECIAQQCLQLAAVSLLLGIRLIEVLSEDVLGVLYEPESASTDLAFGICTHKYILTVQFKASLALLHTRVVLSLFVFEAVLPPDCTTLPTTQLLENEEVTGADGYLLEIGLAHGIAHIYK